jgi:4'-phosphopantetheinyl transferase
MTSREGDNNRVDLWILPLSTQSVRPPSELAGSSLLTEAEKNRYNHFKIDSKREEFLFSRLLLRFLLQKYSTFEPTDVEAVPDQMGRPFWKHSGERIPLYFSLSHTRKMICCALSFDAESGCDVEQVRPRKYERELTRKVFSKEEASFYQRLPDGEKREFFYRSWTLKEAFVKAMGKGLRIPFTSLSFTHTGVSDKNTVVQPASLDLQLMDKNWTFFSTQLQPDYILSCATSIKSPEISLNYLSHDTLSHNSCF